ncbi:glycosyltransferase family protein [bacterium]|nr:glycosyltransferase family protein [bacterium]
MTKQKTVAMIQARMGSSRLPGKILLPLAGKPAISHVFERVKKIKNVDQVVLLTSTSSKENPLIELCRKQNYEVFRGSENDVLDRYYQAAVFYEADIIVRITGDCPLIDPIESSKVVQKLQATAADYCSNTNPPFLPDGLDTEAFTFDALKRAWHSAVLQQEREHVTLLMYSNPKVFSVQSITNISNQSGFRLTLDEKQDYTVLKIVFDHLKAERKFGYLNEVLDLLKRFPEIPRINQHIFRNEGLESTDLKIRDTK